MPIIFSVGTATSLLVTGASGFVGARVVASALERGHHVTALVGPRSSVHRLAPLRHHIDLVRADITDAPALSRAVAAAQTEVCIHLAAAGAVVRDDDLEALLAANAVAPARLAEALGRAGGTRLVTAGSSSEYGTPAGAMDEALAACPDDPYGVAKLAGGLLAGVVAARHGLQTAHLRLFSVYGPGEDPRRLVPAVLRALLARQPIALTPGNQVRDFVYVDDAAQALLDAAERPLPDRVTLNVGTGVQTTVRELCEIAAELTGGRHLLRFGALPYRADERFQWQAATAHAREVMGWTAPTSLAEGLAITVDEQRGELWGIAA